MTARRRAAGLALLLLATMSGCGYSLRGTLPDHVQTIAVPVFKNGTTQPGVEAILTRAVVEAFATSGRLRVATLDRADSILEGEVVGYEIQSIAFDPSAQIRLYRLVVTMNLRLRDVKENKLLLDQKIFRERADFQVANAVSDTVAREEVAVRSAAGQIARSVVTLAIERF